MISTSSSPAAATPEVESTKILYPLTSFASTPHNIACISFLLGVLCSVGLVIATNSIWRNVEIKGLNSSILGVYLSAWAIFHLLEFCVTSMWNPNKLSASSFLLDNGSAYHIAHFMGMLEHVIELNYLPKRFLLYKSSPSLILAGFLLLVAGQFLRSFAMITAAGNFSHLVAYKKLNTHELVTNGIYSWSRHPSYAGFVWWALGTQIMLGNPIGIMAFSIVLYRFFSHRIAVEEQLLIKFFGKKYVEYRTRVPTRILFIR